MSSFLKDFLLGGVSGSLSKTITAPLERVKLLLQVQDNKGDDNYKGMADCFSRVAKEQGLAAFWRGNNANLVRYFPTQALNFSTKERYNKMFVKHTKDENFMKFFFGTLAAGGAAGATSMAVVYPLDFARTRMAADKGVGENRKYTSMMDCMKKLSEKEGVKGLYKGFPVSLAGIIVYRAAFFGLYDVGKAIIYPTPSSKPNPFKSLVLAFSTDTFAGVAAYPFDTVRRRMMMQAGSEVKEYENTVDCTKKIIKNEGFSALYKGCGSNILRGLGGALVLVFYDTARSKA
eukprot:GHVH01004770.1.p1 GENE.GHVH01004770.1~~GHVH01004770.1.p1  ORF type:complete len:289 (+),score=49.60 GHVH01004770.1:105-971(+)